MASLNNLPVLIRDRFKSAHEHGDLNFFETRVTILQCYGSLFQLRFSPALANKPKNTKPREPGERPVNPFLNPEEALLVTELGSSHIIVLNKFSIIPGHFILVTKEYKPQTELLEEDDVAAAYNCIKAYQNYGEELFGFFNSGEHSGASQPHRHIQFLPVEAMRTGIENELKWDILADSLVDSVDLPFTYFASPIPESPSPKKLHEIYLGLYNRACRIAGKPAADTSQASESSISYNIGITNKVMAICPRTNEGTPLDDEEHNSIGFVALNGTILGGTLLVKNESEWNALRGDKSKLQHVLGCIGIRHDIERKI
ncbi:HIT-like domain-containing protein [Bisporella sp. PMI_857]|nr:HIT-like domain-containing protein [Bisporella sp. PMI_857]